MMRLTVITIAALMLAAGCAGGAAPTTSSTPTPTTAPTASPAGGTLPLRAGALAAGTYTTTKFEPRLTMTLGEGWRLLFQDDVDEIAFERAGPAFFGISFATQVVDQATGQAIPAPDDLVVWLASHPALEADEPQPATVAGVTGSSLEAAVKQVPQMDVFAHPEGDYHVVAGERIRFFVLPFDGPDLVVLFSTASDRFDAMAAQMQPVIDSIEIHAAP